MDEALEWLRWLEVKDGRIVWLRACHVRWNLIGARFHLTRRGAWQRWGRALEAIAERLNRKAISPFPLADGKAPASLQIAKIV
jgi:hypothetical protein